jgi:hypothetical protein
MSNSAQRLIILRIIDQDTGLDCGLGMGVSDGFRMKRNERIVTFGKVILCTVGDVASKRSIWSRYGVLLTIKMAASFGVIIAEDSILIPAALTRDSYIFGDEPHSTPLDSLDATNKGGLINSCLNGQKAHLTWKITYSNGEWGVDILCALEFFVARGKGITQLLLYYGPEYVSYLEELAERAAALKALVPKRFVAKTGGSFCPKCKKFFPKKKFITHKSGRKCKN